MASLNAACCTAKRHSGHQAISIAAWLKPLNRLLHDDQAIVNSFVIGRKSPNDDRLFSVRLSILTSNGEDPFLGFQPTNRVTSAIWA
jgi:hypothetical protein